MVNIVVVESVQSKFGPQLRDKDGYLSFGKFYKGETIFSPGTTVEVDLFTTTKGNRYINSLTVVAGSYPAPLPSDKLIKKAKKIVTSMEDSPEVYKPRDFDSENRGKTASLFVEALLANPNVTQNLSEVNVDKMESLVWELVDLVFKTRKEKV